MKISIYTIVYHDIEIVSQLYVYIYIYIIISQYGYFLAGYPGTFILFMVMSTISPHCPKITTMFHYYAPPLFPPYFRYESPAFFVKAAKFTNRKSRKSCRFTDCRRTICGSSWKCFEATVPTSYFVNGLIRLRMANIGLIIIPVIYPLVICCITID